MRCGDEPRMSTRGGRKRGGKIMKDCKGRSERRKGIENKSKEKRRKEGQKGRQMSGKR